MLLIALEAGSGRYGVPASRIFEIVPVPVLRPLPGTPGFVSGAFSYHGSIVPVIDLSVLLTGCPARQWLSTRILIMSFRPAGAAAPIPVGFLAERVTEAVECRRDEFQSAGVHGCEAPYAGDILVRPDGLVQELDVDRLLTEDLQKQLFTGESAQV